MTRVTEQHLREVLRACLGDLWKFELMVQMEGYDVYIHTGFKFNRNEVTPENFHEKLQKRLRKETPIFRAMHENYECKYQKQQKEIMELKQQIRSLEPYRTYYSLEYDLRHGKEFIKIQEPVNEDQ